jgi:hypothetical protein
MEEFDAAQFKAEYETPAGQKLWQTLNRPDVIARMETASDLGHPALAPVEDILLEALGEVILEHRFKQMAGRMTKQIMERRGFIHDASDVRLNSVPFYKASRYRRRDLADLYLFKNSSNPRDVCLVATRKGDALPTLAKGRWKYVSPLVSSLKAQVGYQLTLRSAAIEVARVGFFRHQARRILRSS